MGLEAVLLTGDPSRYLGIGQTGATVVRCDTNSPGPLRCAVGQLLPARIRGVTTTSEFYLLAAAELADALGMSGNPPDVIKVCRDKAAVRRALDAAGVPQPRFAVISSLSEVDAALAGIGLPCVVKPVDDSGSNNVRICASRAETAAHAAAVLAVRVNVRGQPTARTALVEQYVDGPEFSVEMFSADGEAECVGITRKTVTGPPYCVETGHLYPADVDQHLAAALTETTRALLKALGVRSGPTHTEFRVGADGPALIELNCRLAGGMIPELIRLVDGVDLIEQQLRYATGERPSAVGVHSGSAGIRFITARSSGVLRGVAGIDAAGRTPGIVRAAVTMKLGTQVGQPRNAYHRIGFVIAAGSSPAAVAAALDAAGPLEPLLD
jgi:S-sulfo-L-cysteine synthase (3-phospho-L-serine-dependent)